MKVPICNLCLKSNVLCSGCEEKLQKGKLTQLDVDISKTLYRISEKYNLEQADFTKAIDLGMVIMLLTKGDVGMLIGKEGKVVSELSQSVGKKVRIAEATGDVKKTISDILMPVKLLGINTIFSGSERVYKVRLLKSEMKSLPLDINSLERALQSLLESKVAIAFE